MGRYTRRGYGEGIRLVGVIHRRDEEASAELGLPAGKCRVWVESCSVVAAILVGCASLAISPGGRLVAAGDIGGPNPQVTVFDVQTGRRIKKFVAPENWHSCVETAAFSPDGTKLLCGESFGEVALWELSSGRLLFRRKLHAGNVMAVVFSPDGRLFASGGVYGVIHLRSGR